MKQSYAVNMIWRKVKQRMARVKVHLFLFHLFLFIFVKIIFFTILALKKRNSEKTYLRSIQIFEIIEKESFA